MAQTNVLVVEDESIVSKDIQHSLKKLGYNVVGAANTGELAVSLALEHMPDIILMDIMLKGEMNGIEAADAIRKETNIPVIFLTAYADESTLAKAKVTQPYGYIIKPFKEIDIHTSIEMALYKHKKETEVLKERDLLYSLVENKDAGGRDIMFVKSNSRLVKLKTGDIYFIEALKDYVVINIGHDVAIIAPQPMGIEGQLVDEIVSLSGYKTIVLLGATFRPCEAIPNGRVLFGACVPRQFGGGNGCG